MFEQHPVPQQISSYQFRLVGDMTIKQFFEVAGGAVIGLLIYALPLPGFLKWPLVVLSAVMGAAFAFLPIQERPFEEWLMAFFRSIYSPTLYYWTKIDQKRDYFTPPQEAVAAGVSDPQLAQQPNPNDQLDPAHTKNLDDTEKSFLSTITNLIKFPGSKPAPPANKPAVATIQAAIPDPVTTTAEVQIPKQQVIAVAQQGIQDQKPTPKPINVQTQTVAQATGQQTNTGAEATYSQAATPPIPPTQPNIIVGQVLDNTGKIVDGAILEVLDEMGRPARALKTNNVGHFLIVTPLAPGKYQIVTEKEGLIFDPITFEAKGELIPSIAIRSK